MQQLLKFIHISDLHYSEHPHCLNIPQVINDHGMGKTFVQAIKSDYEKTVLIPHTYNTEVYDAFNIKLKELLKEGTEKTGSFIDFVLLTGDIATTASKEDLSTARNLLKIHNDIDIIDGLPVNQSYKVRNPKSYFNSIQLLPGNHDRFTFLSDGEIKKQGLEIFSDIFPDKWEKEARIEITENEYFITIFVDFTLPIDFFEKEYKDHDNGDRILNTKDKRDSFFGRGIYTEDLKEALESLLDKIQISESKHKKFLFISHFALIDADDSLKLINTNMLIDTLKKYNITAYFCGHTHEFDIDEIEDGIQHICCGSTTGCDINDNYSFLIHTISLDEKDNYFLKSIPYVFCKEDRYFKKELPDICVI